MKKLIKIILSIIIFWMLCSTILFIIYVCYLVSIFVR